MIPGQVVWFRLRSQWIRVVVDRVEQMRSQMLQEHDPTWDQLRDVGAEDEGELT